MKRLSLIFIVVIFLCSCSPGISKYLYDRQFNRAVTRIRQEARKVIPDSLLYNFPAMNNEDKRTVLHHFDENIFNTNGRSISFNKKSIDKDNLNPLPWIYSESFMIKDVQDYYRMIDSVKLSDSKDLNAFDTVYSYSQLMEYCFNMTSPTSEGLCLYVPDSSKSDSTSTVLLRAGHRRIMKDTSLYARIPEAIEDGYAAGITYSNTENIISYWTIIW